MKYFIIIMAVFALITGCSLVDNNDAGSEIVAAKKKKNTKSKKSTKKKEVQKDTVSVEFKTNKGNFTVELFKEEAPISVENFLSYVDEGFYNDTIFHRVITGFMVQCGGFTQDMEEKANKKAPIKNEADNGLKNNRGTLSMARTADINSATSQFFINVKDNAFLDHGQRDFGYAVFGKVTEGLEVVDGITEVETGSYGYHDDVPSEPIIIESVTRL